MDVNKKIVYFILFYLFIGLPPVTLLVYLDHAMSVLLYQLYSKDDNEYYSSTLVALHVVQTEYVYKLHLNLHYYLKEPDLQSSRVLYWK